LPQEKPLVTLLVLDSNYKDMPLAMWSEELKWVDAELAKPRAGVWLVCMAHHPIFNNGKHHDDHRLLQDWGPLFQRAKVDFYLTGHDHNLQHLEIPDHSTSFVIAGGGGKTAYEIENKSRGPFGRGVNCFATLRFTPDRATVSFFDQDGKRLHEFERTPSGEVTTVVAGESDKPAERVKP
jgi:tartrate-resistant acid phosphatase type 5